MSPRVTILACLSSFALAAPAHASSDGQNWETVTINVALPDNFKLSNETVFRSGGPKGFYEIEDNLMLGYKANKHVTFWLGYTHDPNYLDGHFVVMEHRFRQQVNIDNFAQVGPVKFNGRVRLEERWRDGVAGTGWRLRPYIKATMPLIGRSTLSVSHESFIDLNATSFQKVEGYDRMRNAISVTVPLNKHLNADFGYLNQLTLVRGGPNSSNHVLTLGLTASF